MISSPSSARPPPGRKKMPALGAFILLSLALMADATCPPALPKGCTCEGPDRRHIVKCDGVAAKQALDALEGFSIDRLRLVNCSLPALSTPLNVKNLRSLEITSCGLAAVKESALASVASTLEVLNLSDNDLPTIPLLPSFPKLISLSINRNRITDIPDGAFDGAPKLRQLRLDHNQICGLSSTALSETKQTLELLDLSGNCLGAIPAQALRNSHALMYLFLSGNKIAEIANFNLMNLPKLRELRLDDNILNKIGPMSFMNVPELQFLYMKNNLIADLDGNRLQAFAKLEILDVRNNMLSKLPSFKELPQLKQIRLDGNLIQKVDTLAFTANPRLQMITLQDNAISVVARNSFDSLDQLVVLLLSNNSITSIERGMLDGMKNLQQLNLRNNSLVDIDADSFAPLRQLTTLDLANNQLKRISKGTFDPLPKMFWLDLSGNQLRGFDKGAFTKKISNILLQGNPLDCDDSLQWFLDWVVRNRVRTFFPGQPEIYCSGKARTPLKDLLLVAAKESAATAPPPTSNNQAALLNSILPGLGGLGGAGAGGLAAIPGLGQLASAMVGGGQTNGRASEGVKQAPSTALSSPMARLANAPAADLEKLVAALPNMVVEVPGYGQIDVSKLPPNLVVHVLKGGQIPGIPKEALDRIVQQYTAKLSEMAGIQREQQGLRATGPVQIPPPPTSIHGGRLPTNAIRQYAANDVKSLISHNSATTIQQANEGPSNVPALPPSTFSLNPAMLEMMKLLPTGYNISRIPAEVMGAISRGEVPDLKLLPADLQLHLKSKSNDMLAMFAHSGGASNISLESILDKLPRWERPNLPTYSPYDINEINNDLVQEEEAAARAVKMRYITIAILVVVALLSVVATTVVCVHMRKRAVTAPATSHARLMTASPGDLGSTSFMGISPPSSSAQIKGTP